MCMCNTIGAITTGVYRGMVDHPITSWQYRLYYYFGDKTSRRIKRLECRNSVSLFIKCVRIVRPTILGVHTLGLSSMSSIDPPTDRPTDIHIRAHKRAGT